MFIKKYIKYPLEALFISIFFYLIKTLPINIASNFGGFLAKLIAPFLKANKIAKENLTKAFPLKTEQEINQIIKKMWNNLGRTAAEFPNTPKIIKNYKKHIEIIGLEHILALKNDEKPGLFISAHLANWELSAAACFACNLPLHRIYRAANNPFVEKLIYDKGRSHNFGELIPKGAKGAKKALELLKQNEHLGILIDQKMNDGIKTLLFNRPAMTASAPAQFAIKFQCPVVMVKIERLKGTNFKIIVNPPFYAEITDKKQEDIKNLTQKMNNIIENWIKETPEQWLWAHNRWKKD